MHVVLNLDKSQLFYIVSSEANLLCRNNQRGPKPKDIKIMERSNPILNLISI